jgi:hypothetical protein
MRYQRLLWLGTHDPERGGVLTERRCGCCAKRAGGWSTRATYIEAPHPDHLLRQDTYFVGTMKGVGKIDQQTVFDAHNSQVFGKLYLSKAPMTAVDVLHDRVLPYYEELGRRSNACSPTTAENTAGGRWVSLRALPGHPADFPR